MKLIIYIFCILIIQTSPLVHAFSYDSAIYAAQKGKWQDAHATLNNIITHNPDNADVMYDAGVAAYNLGHHGQAATCFTRAAQGSTDKDICFRGYFNAGNAYVDHKDLKSALEQYNKALAIEPDNEYARHNRDRVKEMLKEQQKEENNQQNKKDKKDKQNKQEEKDEQENQDKQDQQEKEDKQDNEQNQNGNDDQSGDNKQEQDNDKQQGDSKDQFGQNKQKGDKQKDKQSPGDKQDGDQSESSQDKLDEKSQRDQGHDAADGSQDTERKEQGNKEQQQKNSANNEQRNGKDELDKQTNDTQGKGDKKQSDQHAQTPEKQNNNNDKSNVSSYGKQEQVIDDPWLMNILNNQEMHDKAINKQLMEAKIRQHGGKNGQNCW